MPLTVDTFVPLSAQANSDAPRMWSYGTPDNIAVVEGANYFDEANLSRVTLTGDVLLSKMGDGTKLYNLTSDPVAETVTISAGTAIA